jgi:hypothetical protein
MQNKEIKDKNLPFFKNFLLNLLIFKLKSI